MSTRNRIGTIVRWGLLATGVASSVASASTSPAGKCAASQLKAIGKLASASLACHAMTATTQHPPGPCITKAMTTFAKAWTAAEAKGGCTTPATETDVEAEVGSVVDAAVGALTGTPEDALLTTPAARACAARKLTASGKGAKRQFACDATGVEHATLISPACVERAGGAFVKAWAAAETKGGCATSGDEVVEDRNVNGLSVWGVTHLGPPFAPVSCGTFLTTWGSAGSGNGQFSFPIGVAVDGSGNVFVADSDNRRIQKFDNSGTFLTTWGSFGSGSGQFDYAPSVAVDGSGHVFVADTFNNRIQKFDNSGTFLTTWGSAGSGNGEFDNPVGVAVDGSGNVFVADGTNNRIQKFDNSGTFLTAWGSFGSGNGQFNLYPSSGVAIDGSGNVFVADANNARIQKFDNSGTFLTTWGSFGSGNGQFSQPLGVAVDGSGNVFVAEGNNNRIQKFACCESTGQGCATNAQCCSNFCQGQSLVCDCFGTGDACPLGAQACCSGSCVGGVCCLGIAQSCTTNAECCSNFCQGQSHVCDCLGAGDPCPLGPQACCSGSCVGGVCS